MSGVGDLEEVGGGHEGTWGVEGDGVYEGTWGVEGECGYEGA